MDTALTGSVPLEPALALIGIGVGVLYGAFGAGGSAFATPVLALLGVPPVLAVASPLPATIPAALAGAWSYRRSDDLAGRVARRAIVAGFPAAVLGALSSSLVPDTALLALSAAVLVLAGWRMLSPARIGLVAGRDRATVVAAAGVGFAAGLLANSGGFLLVPVFVLLAGLRMRQAAATSLLVAGVLSVPTLATHWALGHVDWTVAGLFGLGLVPGTLAGTRLARHLPPVPAQRAFGLVLILFAGWFLLRLR